MSNSKKTIISEDWLSLWLGLFVFVLSSVLFINVGLPGWGINTNVWSNISEATTAVSKNYESLPGFISIILTYLFLLFISGIGLRFTGVSFKKFFLPFTIVFYISYFCWLLGDYAYIAAASNQPGNVGISRSFNLTGKTVFLIALLSGLVIGNFFPKTVEKLKETTRPELYIKTAIVIMVAGLGVKVAEPPGLASSIMFRGLCATIEAYLIYRALVYFVARKYFKFSREWSDPLASGISIYGVSAAIVTCGAIRARSIIPIMVPSLIVIFVVFELIILPILTQIFQWTEPLVVSACTGLTVKTGGAAVASSAVTGALILAKTNSATGVVFKEGWMVMNDNDTTYSDESKIMNYEPLLP